MLSDAQTRWHLASLQVGWHAEPGLGSHTHCAGNAARLCSSERVQQPVRLLLAPALETVRPPIPASGDGLSYSVQRNPQLFSQVLSVAAVATAGGKED